MRKVDQLLIRFAVGKGNHPAAYITQLTSTATYIR